MTRHNNDRPICDVMVKNETIRNAVDVVGSHYPIQGANLGVGRSFPQAGPLPASCQELDVAYNKSMWTSEGWNLAYVRAPDNAANPPSHTRRFFRCNSRGDAGGQGSSTILPYTGRTEKLSTTCVTPSLSRGAVALYFFDDPI